jgi:hypothetical protein
MAELLGGLGEPLVEELRVLTLLLGVLSPLGVFPQALLAVGDHQENDTANAAGHRECDLDEVELVLGLGRVRPGKGRPTQAQPPQQRRDSQSHHKADG